MRDHGISDRGKLPITEAGMILNDLTFHTRNRIDKNPNGTYVYLPRAEQVKRQKREGSSSAKKRKTTKKTTPPPQPLALSLDVGEASSSQEA